MGTWGISPLSDDTARDVINSYDDYLKDGLTHSAATSKVKKAYASDLKDPDYEATVWLALAERHWQYGYSDPKVLDNVRDIVKTGRGQYLWKEQGEKVFMKRMSTLRSFYNKIITPKSRPKNLPKKILRAPIFKMGDCLSIFLDNGKYAAALVLSADTSNPEYGINKIVTLKYYSDAPPQINDFITASFLKLTHHKWAGQLDVCFYLAPMNKKCKNRIMLVGNIDVSQYADMECKCYASWLDLGNETVYELEKLDD
jgi:hypothetical protein